MNKTVNKKFRYYDSHIPRVLKTISNDNSIASTAKKQLNGLLIALTQKISDLSCRLSSDNNRRTISGDDILCAFMLICDDDEMCENASKECEIAISNLESCKDKNTSRQKKASILFPPSIAEKVLRKNAHLISMNCPVYLAVIVEFICMTILYKTLLQMQGNCNTRITVQNIDVTIKSDNALRRLVDRFNVKIIGGGDVQFIHPELLNKQSFTRIRKNSYHKPGSVVIRDIQRLQKIGNTLIMPKNAFEKCVRSICNDIGIKLKISKHVFPLLQHYIEEYVVDILRNSNAAAIHANRVKVMDSDIHFVLDMFDIPYSKNIVNKM
mgnify:CR=1 FL=1